MGLIVFFVTLFFHVIFGFITSSMNEEKGYSSGFAWGFFLGVIGIIIIAIRPFKPENNENAYTDNNGNISELQNRHLSYCLSCRSVWMMRNGQAEECSNCGRTLIPSGISSMEWLKMTDKTKNMLKASWFDVSTSELLSILELEEYTRLFLSQNINEAKIAVSLNDNDLSNLGIPTLGERKRLLSAFDKPIDFEKTSKADDKLLKLLSHYSLESFYDRLVSLGIDSLEAFSCMTTKTLDSLGIPKDAEEYRKIKKLSSVTKTYLSESQGPTNN